MLSASLLQRITERIGAEALHDALTPGERLALRYCWEAWARPLHQLEPRKWKGQLAPPGDWSTWLYLAGRGSGKTRSGAEQVRRWAAGHPGCQIALVGRTAPDTRKVMVKGESGILACCPPWDMPHFNVTDQCLEWRNGSKAFLYSADKPSVFRGPQHHFAWADELAAWRYLQDAWDNLMFGLRLGVHPRVLITTTPQPLKLLKDIMLKDSTVVTVGSTYENAANLARSYFRDIVSQYEGSALGRQELHGELLEQAPGALFMRSWLEKHRVQPDRDRKFRRVVMALDPAETTGRDADDTGIVVGAEGETDGHAYILRDATLRASPDQWARKAVAIYWEYGCSVLIYENTRGGDVVPALIRNIDARVNIRCVSTRGAGNGKFGRAEPIAAFYEQGRVHHVGEHRELEDQLCTWTDDAKWSPDRMDAMVHVVGELLLKSAPALPTTSRHSTRRSGLT
ncbi:MAG: DNA-packaging protein [Myxococcales bacterium]